LRGDPSGAEGKKGRNGSEEVHRAFTGPVQWVTCPPVRRPGGRPHAGHGRQTRGSPRGSPGARQHVEGCGGSAVLDAAMTNDRGWWAGRGRSRRFAVPSNDQEGERAANRSSMRCGFKWSTSVKMSGRVMHLKHRHTISQNKSWFIHRKRGGNGAPRQAFVHVPLVYVLSHSAERAGCLELKQFCF